MRRPAGGSSGSSFPAVADATMTPGWYGTRTYNEALLMVTTGGAPAVARTLFTATNIVAVQNSAQTVTYTQGVDWTYDAATRTLTAPPGSAMVTVDQATLLPGGLPLLDESHQFHLWQSCITYDHAPNAWYGPTTSASAKLATTRGKLAAGSPVTIVYYGDSITVGASASGYFEGSVSPTTAAPFLPIWPDLLTTALAAKYPLATITPFNPSLGGQTSTWGATNVHSLVTSHNPDLVVIAFGMNDQSAGATAATLTGNITTIMNDVRATNANAEFIIVAPMSPNPAWSGANAVRDTYLAALTTQAAGAGIALADMTTTHKLIIAAKKYTDQTGNGVNHPADWLLRWYAQMIGGLLGLYS